MKKQKKSEVCGPQVFVLAFRRAKPSLVVPASGVVYYLAAIHAPVLFLGDIVSPSPACTVFTYYIHGFTPVFPRRFSALNVLPCTALKKRIKACSPRPNFLNG